MHSRKDFSKAKFDNMQIQGPSIWYIDYCAGRLEFFRYRKEVRVDGDGAVDQ